jgi:putative flippase GtrA
MIGAVSTTLDLCTGGLVLWLGGPTRAAAMAGTTVGSTFTYFANRHFAFKDHAEPVAKSGIKFFAMQAILGVIHGQVVVWLRDGAGIPYVVAKMMADLMVVTGPQLLIMRHIVFPKTKAAPPKP